ncbi:FAD binding domain protein [Penicillium alfredii]|uniref:FAD binding domain protein n=1 Tax=Penicillium alfredii TaxID=1506179 RepID=A0A9W9ES93_9EURO|nr:FAD binding domain protein [Penicillium alfredii]KAJ5086965.1 FAD binding domain protein [Penicillium alfredii]
MAQATRLVLFLITLLPGIQAGLSSPSCRCFPGDACWPSVKQWSDFNATIGGRLISTTPLGSVCHTSKAFGAYDARACADLKTVWPLPATHYETAWSPMQAWFTNFSCNPFLPPDAPCTTDPFVRYAVNVSSAVDVRKTLAFTSRHNIRVVIRNTGHDYLGKSTGPGAVVLWTYHLKHMESLHYTSPVYSGPAMRVGAGVQGFEAMAAAHARNKLILTGNCPTIGVTSGYSQGGGHGQLASLFGLAADQILEWEVVSAAGELLTVSPEKHPDLYWALAGGGGGTYAVVLSGVVKVYPERRTATATLTFDGSEVDPRVFWDVIQHFVVAVLPVVDAGGVAVWAVIEDSFSVTPITLPGGTREQLQSHLQSTVELLKRHKIPYVNHNATALFSALRSIAADDAVISGISMNVSRTQPPNNAVNPAWRNSAISVTLGTTYNYTDRAVDVQRQELMTKELLPRLELLTPGSGAYLNEGDFNQPDWQRVFYGRNYPRLEAIKVRYDPRDMFYARTAVGSERWVERKDGRLCRRGSGI